MALDDLDVELPDVDVVPDEEERAKMETLLKQVQSDSRPRHKLPSQMTDEELKDAGYDVGPLEGDATHAGQLDLRVGQIIEVAPHDDDEMIINEVDLGNYDESRLLVSEIGEHYDLKDLVNKKVVILCNVIPTDLRHIGSKTGKLLLGYKEVKVEKKLSTVDEYIQESGGDYQNQHENIDKQLDEEVDEFGEIIYKPVGEEVEELPPEETTELVKKKKKKKNKKNKKDKKSDEPLPDFIMKREVVEVPADSVLGSRVYLEGCPNEPFPPSDEEMYEFVLKELRVNEDGFVCYKDKPLRVEGFEGPAVFTQSLTGCPIRLD